MSRLIILCVTMLLTALSPSAAQETMTAIRMHEFGSADVLRLEEAPAPEPGDGEMLVRVYAAGVNPVDWKLRAGGMGGMVELPYTPGFDVSGVVERVGPGVTKFEPDDEVFAMLDLRRGGGYAEYAIVREDEAARKPDNITHVEAASAPLVALTAWQVLFDTADLQEGQSVLIHAGAGGVGSHAVQFAKWKGAVVYATASERNHDYLRQLGADVVIDYNTQKFEDIAKEMDVVLDSIGGDTRERSWGVLKRGGILVSIVGPPSQAAAEQHGVRAASILVHPDADELAQIAGLIEEGHLKPVVNHVFPLSDAAKAHEQSETHHTRGKIVLEVVEAAPADGNEPAQ